MPCDPSAFRFVRTSLAAALAALVALGLARADLGAAASLEQARRPTDREMFVSVLDKHGAPVAGLAPDDFLVREDGVAREVLAARQATDPITLALLLDNSQAVRPYFADMRPAVKAFVKRLGQGHTISVTTFGERPTLQVDYTLDVASVIRGIDKVFPASGSGSYLLEAVEVACSALSRRDADRPVIVAVTAGGPEFSDRPHTEFPPKLRECGATFDVMVLVGQPPDLSDSGQRNREMFLDVATRATGGDRVPLLSSLALDGALAKLADELTGQYRITYSRPERLIPPERIEVSVRRPGLVARGTPIKVRRG